MITSKSSSFRPCHNSIHHLRVGNDGRHPVRPMHTQSFNRLSSPTLRGKDLDTDKPFDLDARGRGGRNQAPTAEREERPAHRQQPPRTNKRQPTASQRPRDHQQPRRAGAGGERPLGPAHGRTPPAPAQPTNGEGCSIFFFRDVLCIFYSWGGTHKFGKPFDLDARARGGRKQAPTAEREERPARRQQRPRTIKKSLGKQKTTSEDPTNTTNNQP